MRDGTPLVVLPSRLCYTPPSLSCVEHHHPSLRLSTRPSCRAITFIIDIFMRNMMALFSLMGKTLQAAQAAPLPVIALMILLAGAYAERVAGGWGHACTRGAAV